jgi:archaellum biogenesis ATPase FlaH
LKNFHEIIVFGDFEKGRISLLEEMKIRFPGRIRHVRFEDYKGCKDANEILLKHGKEAVRKAVENAASVQVKNIIPLAEVENVNIYTLDKLKTGIPELDRDLYGGLPFGAVCIIAGKRGDGKSTFASQIMGHAVDQGHSIFVYSGELPNYLYKSWFDFQIAGPHHITESEKDGIKSRFITTGNQKLINAWYSDKAYIYDSRIIETEEQEDLLKTIEESIRRYSVKVILLDNLMTAMYLDENRGSDKYDQQGRFVRQLTRIALRHNVLILLVAHRRKNSFTTDANDEISGSGDITNLASVTLSYDRMSKEELREGIGTEFQ